MSSNNVVKLGSPVRKVFPIVSHIVTPFPYLLFLPRTQYFHSRGGCCHCCCRPICSHNPSRSDWGCGSDRRNHQSDPMTILRSPSNDKPSEHPRKDRRHRSPRTGFPRCRLHCYRKRSLGKTHQTHYQTIVDLRFGFFCYVSLSSTSLDERARVTRWVRSSWLSLP